MLEAKDPSFTCSLLSFMVIGDALKLQPAFEINRPGVEAWLFQPMALRPAPSSWSSLFLCDFFPCSAEVMITPFLQGCCEC